MRASRDNALIDLAGRDSLDDSSLAQLQKGFAAADVSVRPFVSALPESVILYSTSHTIFLGCFNPINIAVFCKNVVPYRC